MDNILMRLVSLKWYVYRQPDTAVAMLKQISDEIQELLHTRTLKNWGTLNKKGVLRRTQSMPNISSLTLDGNVQGWAPPYHRT